MKKLITLSIIILLFIFLNNKIFSQGVKVDNNNNIIDEQFAPNKHNYKIPFNQSEQPLILGNNGDAVSGNYLFNGSSVGTVLGTTANDDQSFNGLPIGFTFNYNNVAYTTFSVNTNGYIGMGASVSATYTPLSSLTNIISAFAQDLQGQTGSVLSYQTIGTAPYRILTVSWQGYRHYFATGDNFNFQIRLHETSNRVEIIYGKCKTISIYTAQVGINGSTVADYNNRTTTTSWSATTAGLSNAATCTLSSAVVPAPGQTFTWTGTTPVTAYTFSGSTSGTPLAATDDESFVALPIGFTYNYDSSPYTTFSVNANGFIAMGSSILSSYSPLSTGSTNSVISAMGRDIQYYSAPSLWYQTLGSSPNRVLLVNWVGWRKYSYTTDTLNFQIRIYETSSKIEILYLGSVMGTVDAAPQVGLRGLSNADFNNRTTTTNWAATTAGTLNSSAMSLTSTVFPVNGQTFDWDISSGPQNPTAFTATPFSSSQINLGWTLNGSANPVMLAWNTTNTFGTPVGGTSYGVGTTIPGGGTVLLNGSTTTYNHTSLNPATTYYYKIWSNTGTLYSTGTTANATTPCSTVSSLPYAYGFGTTGTLDACWSISQVAGTGNWALATSMTNPTMTPFTLPYMLYFNAFSFSAGAQSRLKSPVLNFTGISNPRVDFYMTRDNGYAGVYPDSLLVEISTNGGTTWTGIYPAFQRVTTNTTPYWEKETVNLDSYAGNSNVLVGFRACGAFGDNFAMDSITIRNATAMAYSSSTTTQTVVSSVPSGSVNQQIIGVQVVTSGEIGSLNTTSFTFNTNGSTNAATDIGAARVWYTGTSSTFATTSQFGSSVSTPNGSFAVNGTQALQTGTNYFWLVYDINSGATQGNFVDAECNSVTVGGNPQTPAIQAPAGNRQITAPMSGTYTIGLGMFNKLTGKNLQQVILTRKVKQLIPVIADNISGVKSKDKGTSPSLTASVRPNDNIQYRETDVTEEYTELQENGKKYTGTLHTEGNNTVSAKRLKDANYSDGDMLNNYATITAAITDLNNRGVSGAVTFLLMDASYPTETYPIQINSGLSGISATNTVTIKPNSGVTSAIPGNIASTAAFKILSNYVTIDGSNSGGTDRSLTIQNTNVTAPSVILFGSTGTTPLTSVVLKNCVIINGVNTSSAVVISDGTTLGNPGYFNTVTIQNDDIRNAYIGVFANGGTSPQNGLNLFYTNNILNTSGANAIRYCGLYMQGVNNANISGNTIANFSGIEAEDDRAIWIATGSINCTIEKNNISALNYTGTGGYGCHGIEVSPAASNANDIIKNNMIYNLSGDGWNYTSIPTDNSIGISLLAATQSGISVYNNSIYLSGNTLNQASSMSMGIYVGTGNSTANIVNNIIVNNLGLLAANGQGSACIFLQTGNSQLSSINNNCYFCNPTGSGTKEIGRIVTTGQTTLSGWAAATGQDANSINVQPLFTSSTNLHIQAADLSISGRGTYLAGVSSDYDGDARATAQSVTVRPVDIGCDQYIPSGYTGNTTVLNGSVYTDGNAKSVEIVSGTFTASSVKQFPGVRTPYNTLMGKPVNGNGNENKPVNKNRNSNDKVNQKSRDGKSGAEEEMMIPVNTPWIYWEINNFVPTSEPVVLRYYYNVDQLATITESTMRLTYWNGSAWDNSFTQSVNTSLHYIQVTLPTGISWPSNLSFAIEDPNNPLPVTISSFNSSASGRDANLIWVTETETNNKGFYLERRNRTGINVFNEWLSVSFINGHGNSNSSITYNYSDKKLNAGDYQYRLKQVDYNGNFEYYSTNSVNDVIIGKPMSSEMSQNYPNPSNPKTKIDYQIPFDGKVSIKVYDLTGREVITLVDKTQNAGYYTTEFDGTNLSSGVYFYRIFSEGDGQKFTKTLKMVLVK